MLSKVILMLLVLYYVDAVIAQRGCGGNNCDGKLIIQFHKLTPSGL